MPYKNRYTFILKYTLCCNDNTCFLLKSTNKIQHKASGVFIKLVFRPFSQVAPTLSSPDSLTHQLHYLAANRAPIKLQTKLERENWKLQMTAALLTCAR